MVGFPVETTATLPGSAVGLLPVVPVLFAGPLPAIGEPVSTGDLSIVVDTGVGLLQTVIGTSDGLLAAGADETTGFSLSIFPAVAVFPGTPPGVAFSEAVYPLNGAPDAGGCCTELALEELVVGAGQLTPGDALP